MDLRSRALCWALVLVALAGCNNPPPDTSPPPAEFHTDAPMNLPNGARFAPQTMLDARLHCVEFCEIHDIACELDVVPIASGMPLPPVFRDPEDQKRRRANPNAWIRWQSGYCWGSPHEGAVVLYCSACRKAFESS